MGWGGGGVSEGMGVLVEDGLCRCWSRDAGADHVETTSRSAH